MGSSGKRLGFSYWGFLERDSIVVNTPDGERGNRVDFVDEMLKRGHDVTCLQRRREAAPFAGVEYDDLLFPDIDLLYVEHRWPTYKNTPCHLYPAAEPDYERQRDLLDHYHAKGVPIVIHDGDLKMTPQEEEAWPNAILTDACITPRVQTRKRISVPWCNYMTRLFQARERPFNYTYVGNNYERDAQFFKYYVDPSRPLREEGIQTSVYGNWLQRSPERKDPSELLRACPSIAFGPRLSYRDIFAVFNDSIAVTHITKSEYTKHGNITGRFFEAVKSGVPAIIPTEYKPAYPVGYLSNMHLVARGSSDVTEIVRELATMDAKTRQQIVDEQERLLRTIIDPRPETRVDLLEAVMKGEVKPR